MHLFHRLRQWNVQVRAAAVRRDTLGEALCEHQVNDCTMTLEVVLEQPDGISEARLHAMRDANNEANDPQLVCCFVQLQS